MYKLVVLFSVVAIAVAKPGLVAPLAYSAAVPAVSSVSQYSSSVLHGSPVVSAAVPAVYSAPAVYGPTVVAPAVVPAVAGLAQAPHSPAVVLDAVQGVPLDTPEVVAARAAHYQAKALSGLHHLKKRSLAPVAYSSVVSPVAPVVSAYSAPLVQSPLISAYSSPVVSAPLVSAYSAPVLGSPLAYSAVGPRALSVHPW
ncbi:cuticle protein 16.5-like [Plodia interpunctella]|uniref:cuticle protein 16.5-like n=1 Tax=Plodia interpunctella TaxID=58824 RepID=UPI0023684CF3|nr:cuticle protein 16.5-like [Plodia interpunctella]